MNDWLLYRGFYIRLNQISGNDPSINQLVISNSTNAPVGQNNTPWTNNDDFYITGLNGANTIAVVNLYGDNSDNPIVLEDIESFAHTYIDNVLYNDQTLLTSVSSIRTAFYANSATLIDSMSGTTLYENFEFNEIQAVYEDPAKGAVIYFNGNYNIIEDYYSILNSFVVAGSGYAVDDEIEIPGNLLGGTTPENDLTITVTSLTPDVSGIDGYSFTGTPNSNAWPTWFITDGDDDQYDYGNYLGTNRSRCTFTASISTNQDDRANLIVTNVAEGSLRPGQSVYIAEKVAYEPYGRFTSIVWQLSGTPGQEGLYILGGYTSGIPDSLEYYPSRVRYANSIPYGVNQALTATDAFGPGSTYGSMWVNSIFSMVAVNADISTFYYSGEPGADGGGEKRLTPVGPPDQNGYYVGLVGTEYDGYFDGDTSWFQTASAIGSEIRSNFNQLVPESGTSWEWTGYFKPLSSDNFTFEMGADEIAFMWIGQTALAGYNNQNVLLSSEGGNTNQTPEYVYLDSNTYYPIRIQFGHPVQITQNGLNIQANPQHRQADDFGFGALFNGDGSEFQRVANLHGGVANFLRLHNLGYF